MTDDLTAGLGEAERALAEAQLKQVSPNDAKYAGATEPLKPFLTAWAEWEACAKVQRALLATRVEFDRAEERHLETLDAALERFDPLNAARLEGQLRHDQLAVIAEIGRHAGEEVEALLHPGTTSYDILDTARSMLLKNAWAQVIRPKVEEVVEKLCGLAETYEDVLQVGRTHLQHTSPVPFGATLAGYARRLAEQIEEADRAYDGLRGKIGGIVGTGASVEIVMGDHPAFEKAVLGKLGLEADLTATQIVQKQRLAGVGHYTVMLMSVLADMAGDMRLLYSSDIGEVTSRVGKRLGGSSADAAKNNPINWENIEGKLVVVQAGMPVLYALCTTDLQRDLRGSVQARYEPQNMLAEMYESFCRASRSLNQLSVNEDRMAANLEPVRRFPSEAMVAITRKYGWAHTEHGVGHEAVKAFSVAAKAAGKGLLEVARGDAEFEAFYNDQLTENERRILGGELELYVGSSKSRAKENIAYARQVIDKS